MYEDARLLCADVVDPSGTAQILMSSGIGNKGDLEGHGLRVLVDIPGLGRNLQVCRSSSVRGISRLSLSSVTSLRCPSSWHGRNTCHIARESEAGMLLGMHVLRDQQHS